MKLYLKDVYSIFPLYLELPSILLMPMPWSTICSCTFCTSKISPSGIFNPQKFQSTFSTQEKLTHRKLFRLLEITPFEIFTTRKSPPTFGYLGMRSDNE